MKKLFISLTLLIGLTNCKSFDSTLIQPGEYSVDPKLPAMEKDIENNYVFLVTHGGEFLGPNPQDISTLFDKELTEKITNPYSDKKGIIVLKINTFKHKISPGAALFIPVIGVFTGFATGIGKTNIEVQLDVLNSNRRLIGSYKGVAETKLKSRLYKNNFTNPVMSRTIYMMTIKTALQEAKKKLAADAPRLIKELH